MVGDHTISAESSYDLRHRNLKKVKKPFKMLSLAPYGPESSKNGLRPPIAEDSP